MAYYSDQGATIMQGVGEYFPGRKAPRAMAKAFKDGVFGARVHPTNGKLMAFKDGLFGRHGAPLNGVGEYFEGAAEASRPIRMPGGGQPMAFRDGVMGGSLPGAASEQAFQSGIFDALGKPLYIDGKRVKGNVVITHGKNPKCPTCITPDDDLDDSEDPETPGGKIKVPGAGLPKGDPMAYNDGILGPEGYLDTYSTTIYGEPVAYEDGILGHSQRRSPRGHSTAGLGVVLESASTSQFTIDMRDPQWVKELKVALVYSLASMGITAPFNEIDEDWYLEPYWDEDATAMSREWAEEYQDKVNPQASRGLLLHERGDVAFFTVTGINTLVNAGIALNPRMFNQEQFPRLYAFMRELAGLPEGAKLDHFRILPPWPSEAAKIRVDSPMNLSSMSWILLGTVLVGALGLVGYTSYQAYQGGGGAAF